MKTKCAIIIVILATILLVACSPSPQAIQTAIAQTQTAWTPILAHTPTHTVIPPSVIPPTDVPTPTYIFPIICASYDSTKCFYTEEGITFILEVGDCMVDAPTIPSTVDPKTDYHCYILKRHQITLYTPADEYGLVQNLDETLGGMVEPYCALFALDGTFIMSNVDITGGAASVCSLPQDYQP